MGDVPKAWLSFGEKWDFFQATKSGESNCWSSEMLAEVKMWTLSKILPTHLFHDPPLYCTWMIIFTLICLPHLLDIGVEKHKLTNSEPQNQKPPVHRGSFHETYLRWTVVLVAPLFGVIAAACSTGRMGTHTTMVTGHILALMSIVANIVFLRWVKCFFGGSWWRELGTSTVVWALGTLGGRDMKKSCTGANLGLIIWDDFLVLLFPGTCVPASLFPIIAQSRGFPGNLALLKGGLALRKVPSAYTARWWLQYVKISFDIFTNILNYISQLNERLSRKGARLGKNRCIRFPWLWLPLAVGALGSPSWVCWSSLEPSLELAQGLLLWSRCSKHGAFSGGCEWQRKILNRVGPRKFLQICILVSCECRVYGPPISHQLLRKNPHLPGGGPSRVAVPRTICDLRLTMVARSLGKASVLDQEGTLGQVSDSKI